MVLLSLLCIPVEAAQEAPSVITYAHYTASLTRRELFLLFTGLIPRWPDGTPVIVVMRPNEDEVTQSFCRNTLHVFPYQLESIINRRKIAGDDVRRIIVDTNSEMISTVNHTPGAVGYGTGGISTLTIKVTDQ